MGVIDYTRKENLGVIDLHSLRQVGCDWHTHSPTWGGVLRYIIYGIYLRYYILILFPLWYDLEYILFYSQYLISLYFR